MSAPAATPTTDRADKMRVLDLFSGIGGMSLGLERAGMQTVAFCEIEPFPRRVLAHHWPEVPIFGDVRKLKGSDVGPVDLICGGYPCQPFSTAGKRRGKEDDRHLWPEFSRLVAELRPSWVIGENVAGHISMGLDDVLSDLEGQGYACRTFVIPACAVNLPHRRDRCWVVAHADSSERGQERGACDRLAQQENSIQRQGEEGAGGPSGSGENVADTKRRRRQGSRLPIHASDQAQGREGQAVEPVNGRFGGERGAQSRLGRVVDGLSGWMDEPADRVKAAVPDRAARLKALGNAVVPQIPELIGRAILEAAA